MKKIISFLLIFIFIFAPVTVFAQTPVLDASMERMGDVNYDGRVNAIDARAVLRYSAKLDKTELDIFRADADGSGKINASDARLILRVSAGLTSFTCGFDGNSVPCVINTLKNGRYYVEASYSETAASDAVTVKIAKNGNDIYLSSNAMEDLDLSTPMGNSSFSECGMLMTKNVMYAIFTNKDFSFAIPIPEENSGDLGIDTESFIEMADIVSAFIADDIGTPEKIVIGDKECFRYSYEISGNQYQLYLDSMGGIMHIDGVTGSGKTTTLITFDKVSGDNPSAYFDLNKYELLEIF